MSQARKLATSNSSRILFYRRYSLFNLPASFQPPKRTRQHSQSAISSLQSFTTEEFASEIASHAKFKHRSHETHHSTHIFQLAHCSKNFTTVLIGDSMFERFKTTGGYTSIGASPSVVNAGVGGDRICQVLYRFQRGLLEAIQRNQGSHIGSIVLHMGSNNLNRRNPLRDDAVYEYELVLEAVRRAFAENCRIVVTAIFERRDVKKEDIEASNGKLKQMVEKFGGRVIWLPAPQMDKKWFLDGAHLNKRGYKVWNEWLRTWIPDLITEESSKK